MYYFRTFRKYTLITNYSLIIFINQHVVQKVPSPRCIVQKEPSLVHLVDNLLLLFLLIIRMVTMRRVINKIIQYLIFLRLVKLNIFIPTTSKTIIVGIIEIIGIINGNISLYFLFLTLFKPNMLIPNNIKAKTN